MKITNAVCAAGRTGFFFDDQRAIKQGAKADGASYDGSPVTPGFQAVRQAGESISVMFVLEDGQIAFGDCAAVQYSGAGGRDPLFLAEDFIPVIEKHLFPRLVGRDIEIESFRTLAEELEHCTIDGARLHTAIRYGVSQALLDAVAKAKHRLMCEVIAEEYGLTLKAEGVPIFTQSGDTRYDNVDKMIIKEAAVLPHGLINNVKTKLGERGELLREYVSWLRARILRLRLRDSYAPVLHLDVYGTIGQVFGNTNYNAMADYLATLSDAAMPFKLRIEGPMDTEDREKQMAALAALTETVDRRKIPVEIVADEWCNTLEDIRYFADNRAGHMVQIKTPDLGGIGNIVEAVRYCKEKGIGAYQGGTCNETDRSAQVCVHLAMASRPDQILAKPGMGVDEGFMIVYNEMQRVIRLLKIRQ
ncbi:MAG: methylaspartate ammonia-lyase [Spirochaetaceae bacterium]|jgi:methylaspartate ammonia-lyase|nr:methylaspartate ammonia-lyase [Spirochaetaceae bacterium]